MKQLALAVPLLVALSACGSDVATSPAGSLTLTVDSALAPVAPSVDGRPLARMVGEQGAVMDFFLGELVVATDDDGKLDAFVKAWGGTVVARGDAVPGVPRLAQVKLDPTAVVVSDLLQRVNGGAKDLRGAFRTSSDAAAKLLALALAEAQARGMSVSPNFLMTPSSIVTGSTNEAPTGSGDLYSPNAFAWPYVNQGSPQNTGLGAAWQALARAGKFTGDNRIKMMIVDAGFAPNADFPASHMQVSGGWNIPNTAPCSGGNPCPWHGTMVTSAAMGTLDDASGAAGPAAPVADLLAVPTAGDFFGVFSSIARVLGGLVRDDVRIINVSSSFDLDIGWDIAAKVACLGLCPSPSELASGIAAAVTLSNKLIVASAGNAGRDVDSGRPEGSTTMPCELATVVCVGGMAHNTTALDPSSNFGTAGGEDTVDIYAPFWTWVGPDPDNRDNRARLVSGTSFSAPFVAGVAALVWAANRDLRATDVWATIRDTAFVGGVDPRIGSQRRINALGAVQRVLAGAAPTLTITPASPTAPLNREVAVTAVIDDDGARCGSARCVLEWSPPPARVVGDVAYFRFTDLGAKTITATTRDPGGLTATATTTLTVENQAPVVSLLAPTTSTTVQQGVPIQLLGSAVDANEGPGPLPGALGCTWTSSNGLDVFPVGCDVSAVFSSPGARTLTLRATDSQGAASSATLNINVLPPPTNLPPNITSGALSPAAPNYTDGYDWSTLLARTASATDPEGDNPITYVWKATSYRPSSTTVYVADVTVATTASLAWRPNTTPSLFGDFGVFGNACFDGQAVQLRLEATDSRGNRSVRTFPNIKIYLCTLQ